MATPDETPEGTPAGAADPAAAEVEYAAAESIAVIDPLIANEKALSACYAERTRLLAELDRLGHEPRIIAGLVGDPVESGRNDPDTGGTGRGDHDPIDHAPMLH